MKGVVLAGGTGSRLYPLTKVTNKHLLPVGEEPMIYHPIRKLIEAGITDIMVITGIYHAGDVIGLLGSGKDFGARFTYKVQDEAGGIAQALGLAEGFVGHNNCCVILGDNIFQDSLKRPMTEFSEQGGGAKILVKWVSDANRYGVAEIKKGRLVSITEKPSDPTGGFAVAGIYFYDSEVFQYIRNLKQSSRGELEITDVNNAYLQAGTLRYGRLDGWWTDAGTFASLNDANRLVTYGPSDDD